MSKINTEIECPICKSAECLLEINNNTNEEWTFCPDCGYHHEYFIKKDKNSKYITKDGTDNFAFGNLIYEEIENKIPYGSYRISNQNGSSQIGAIETENDFLSFLDNIQKELSAKDNIIKEVIVRSYCDGEYVTRYYFKILNDETTI